MALSFVLLDEGKILSNEKIANMKKFILSLVIMSLGAITAFKEAKK